MISGGRIRRGLYRYIVEADLADKQAEGLQARRVHRGDGAAPRSLAGRAFRLRAAHRRAMGDGPDRISCARGGAAASPAVRRRRRLPVAAHRAGHRVRHAHGSPRRPHRARGAGRRRLLRRRARRATRANAPQSSRPPSGICGTCCAACAIATAAARVRGRRAAPAHLRPDVRASRRSRAAGPTLTAPPEAARLSAPGLSRRGCDGGAAVARRRRAIRQVLQHQDRGAADDGRNHPHAAAGEDAAMPPAQEDDRGHGAARAVQGSSRRTSRCRPDRMAANGTSDVEARKAANDAPAAGEELAILVPGAGERQDGQAGAEDRPTRCGASSACAPQASPTPAKNGCRVMRSRPRASCVPSLPMAYAEAGYETERRAGGARRRRRRSRGAGRGGRRSRRAPAPGRPRTDARRRSGPAP